MNESIKRGLDLLLPFNLDQDNVFEIEFAIDKFHNLAAVKSWAKNHGFKTISHRNIQNYITLQVNKPNNFEKNTIKKEKISSNINMLVGISNVKKEKIDNLEIEKEKIEVIDNTISEEIETKSVEFKQQNELFITKNEEGENPEDVVRFFGIVMTPEVPDLDGVVTSKEEIKSANEYFMKDFGTTGYMHSKDVSDKIKIIQNVISPIDFEFPNPEGKNKSIIEGTWYQELYSDDKEMVSKVRKGELTGLSIGGTANQVPIEKNNDINVEVTKNKKENEKEGEYRFHNLKVQEVSVVDAAANNEEFFIIKRRKDVNEEEKVEKKEEETEENVEEKVEEKVEKKEEIVEEVKKTEEKVEKKEEVVVEEQEKDEEIVDQVALGVAKAIKKLLEEGLLQKKEDKVEKKENKSKEEIEKLSKKLDNVCKKLEKIDNIKAVAKGNSVPDTTTKNEEEKVEKSLWSGTAINKIFGKK